MKPRQLQKHESQAARLRTVQMISRLLAATNPHDLGQKLTSQLRELTGAETILLLAHRGDGGGHELLHVCPARQSRLFSADELQSFCPEQAPDSMPRRTEDLPSGHPMRALLSRAGVQNLLSFPLRAGGELLGVLVLLNLQSMVLTDLIVGTMSLLSPSIALALKNARAFRQIERQRHEIESHALELERRVEERTAELAAANRKLSASHLAALNMMEDAVAARDRAQQSSAGLAREIERRSQAEEKIQDQYSTLHGILESSVDPIFSVDAAYRYTSFNRSHAALMEALYGAEIEIGRSLLDYQTVKADRAEAKANLDCALQGEHLVRESFSGADECAHRCFEVSHNPIRASNGSVIGVAVRAHDITERKQAEQALAIQARIAAIFVMVSDDEMFNEVLKVILDLLHSPLGVFGYLDENGDWVVPTMTRQIWDECNIREKSIRFPPETWGDSSWPRAIREKRTICSNETSTGIPEGHVGIQRHISLPILLQGDVIGLFQVANKETDYTEADIRTLDAIAGHVAPLLSARLQRERAQEALRALNAELEQRVQDRTAQLELANTELEAFSYSVSHDLRAPVRAIDGFAGILSEEHAERLDQEGRRLLGVIQSESKRMGKLIDDLLNFSRIGRTPMKLEEIDMTALAQDVWEEQTHLLPERRPTVNMTPLPPARGDRAMIRLVWSNLISNALKFTKYQPNAIIEIGAITENAETTHYYIRDNGAGFNMKYVHKLFGVFQRLHDSSSFEGTGVGLALAQRIIHRHGGSIRAEGKVDAGATFYFSLTQEPGKSC